MVAEKELIMICIDTSVHTLHKIAYSRCIFMLQLEAIRLYCQAKLKSNPKTAIGLLCMGSLHEDFRLKPTSDLDEILRHISETFLTRGGKLDFIRGLGRSLLYLTHQPNKLKRTLIFTGGPISCTPEGAEWFGKRFKEMGVAVDFLNFTLEDGSDYSNKMIESFVAAANKNGNSHLRHVPPEPSTCISHYLPSAPEVEIVAVAAKNKKAEDYKRKNQAAAARNNKAQGYNRENQAAAHDGKYVKARGTEPGKHSSLELWNKFKPLSLDNNENVKLGKGKMVDEYVNARGMEPGKHNSLELRNKFKPLSLDNNENVKVGKGKMVAERSLSAAELRR